MIPTPQILLELADPLTARNPPLPVRLSAPRTLLRQCRPVRRMLVLEIQLTAGRVQALPQLLLRHVFGQVLVEFHLFACDGVDERGY